MSQAGSTQNDDCFSIEVAAPIKMAGENERYVSVVTLCQRYEVTRPTVWRWVREGLLPEPYRFNSHVTRWRLSEVLDYENKKLAA